MIANLAPTPPGGGGEPLPPSSDFEACRVSDELDAPVEIVDGRGAAPAVSLPTLEGVAAWRVETTLFFGDLRFTWWADAEPGTALDLVVPDEAFVTPMQEDWLSALRTVVWSLDAESERLDSKVLEPYWVVWGAGPSSPPTWLDDAARRATAPLGAWSAEAVGSLPDATSLGADVEFAAPWSSR